MSKVVGICEKCGKKMRNGVFTAVVNTPYQGKGKMCGECAIGMNQQKLNSNMKAEKIAINSIKLMTVGDVPKGMEVLGIASGSTVRARSAFSGVGADFQKTFGGEVTVFTELLEKARQEALYRCQIAAYRMGAEMVVQVRFSSSTIDIGTSEVTAYGTALKRSELTVA